MKAWASILAVGLSSCSAPPDPPRERPAVLIVLDASGSMAGTTFDLLKAACESAAGDVGALGEVGLLAFSTHPTWALEIGPSGRAPSLAWSTVKPEGVTDLKGALAEALRAFGGRPSGHMILVSDGDAVEEGLEASVRRMVDRRVTVSVVCAGTSPRFDAAIMSRMADWGQGRFGFTHRPDNLRKLLVHDARAFLEPR